MSGSPPRCADVDTIGAPAGDDSLPGAAQVAVSPAQAAVSPAQVAVPPPQLRVLVALHGERSPDRALRFAQSFAVALGAELHVLRVVPHVEGAPAESAPEAHHALATALREAQRVLAAARRARALCDSVLSAPLPSPHLCIRLGTFVEQVAQRAAELDASIIALPSTKAPLAATMIRVARQADRPVIVARGRPDFKTLLAATDLEDAQVPLLRRAVHLGRELGAKVLALHGVLGAAGPNAEPASMENERCSLEHATRALEAPLERIVVRSRDVATSIIEQARARNADLIMVGVRPHLTRRHPSTAARVLRQARRPVLVAPLGASQRG